MAEEHYKGDAVEWMRGTCIDMIDEDIARAHAAYRKAMAGKPATGPEAPRCLRERPPRSDRGP